MSVTRILFRDSKIESLVFFGDVIIVYIEALAVWFQYQANNKKVFITLLLENFGHLPAKKNDFLFSLNAETFRHYISHLVIN